MRIYADVFEMHSEVKRDIHEMGVVTRPATMQDIHVEGDPNYETLELSPCVFSVLEGKRNNEWIESLGLSLPWCKAEMDERWGAYRLNSVNPGEAWKIRRETWEPFIHQERFAYTYSERFFSNHSLGRVINQLSGLPDTRQAVLPVFSTEPDMDHVGGIARVPCSMHYQFLRRPDGLRCYYVMRSSDFLTHFPYDIWLAMELQKFIAGVLDTPTGMFTFFSGSLHIYRKDAEEGVF